MTTVLLLAHPAFDASRANRALLSGVADLPGLEVTDLYALYPERRIDAGVERARLLRATRLVFQFPLQWYSTPSLLKEWEDAVLTPLFYGEPDIATRTAGLPFFAATTTGGPWDSYRPGGAAMTVGALLTPLQATALKCRWAWQPPFAVHDVRNLDDAALTRAGEKYRTALSSMPALERRPAAVDRSAGSSARVSAQDL